METFKTYSEAVQENDTAHQAAIVQRAKAGTLDMDELEKESRMWFDYLAWVHREAQYRTLN